MGKGGEIAVQQTRFVLAFMVSKTTIDVDKHWEEDGLVLVTDGKTVRHKAKCMFEGGKALLDGNTILTICIDGRLDNLIGEKEEIGNCRVVWDA